MTTTTPGRPPQMGPFDETNRAWQRLSALLDEHFEVMHWHRESDRRPVLVVLSDLNSGDMVALAVMDSLEQRDPYLLLAIDQDGQASLHGPFTGGQEATRYGPVLALRDDNLALTHPIALTDPDQPPPDSAWIALPDGLAGPDTLTVPAAADGEPVAVLLHDPATGRVAATGPFPDDEHAHAWAAARAGAHAGSHVPTSYRTGIHPAQPA